MSSIDIDASAQRTFDSFDLVLEPPVSRASVVAGRVVAGGLVLVVAPIMVVVALCARVAGAMSGEPRRGSQDRPE